MVVVSEAWDCWEAVLLMAPLVKVPGGSPGTVLSDRAIRVSVEDTEGFVRDNSSPSPIGVSSLVSC